MREATTAQQDWISHEDLVQWVPGERQSCSKGLDWQDFSQCTYKYAGQEVKLPSMKSFMIVQYREGSTPMDRELDGHWTRTQCGPGNFSLLSRAVDTHWNWPDDIVVSHIYLENRLLKRVAQDIHDADVDQVVLDDVLCGSDPVVNQIVSQLSHEAENEGPSGAMYAEALSIQLSVHLLHNYATIRKPIRNRGGRLSSKDLNCLEEFIERLMHETITLEQLARLLGMGTWTLNRYLRAAVGQSVYGFVQSKRLSRAKALLKTKSLPLKQIAADCGFSDQAHMTRMFRKTIGITPGKFRSEN